MSVIAPSLGNLWRVIQSYDMDPRPLFEAEGIDTNRLTDPGMRVPYAAMDRVRSRAAELTGDPDFGLRAERFVHPSHLGALGHAWIASDTLRSGLIRMNRYLRIVHERIRLSLRNASETVEVTVTISESSLNPRVQHDTIMATLLGHCRTTCGPEFCPEAVRFPHSRPASIEGYRAVFGCEPEFDAPDMQMVVLAADVDAELPTADALLAGLSDRAVARALTRFDADSLVDRVRAQIVERLPTGERDLTDEAVAQTFHMSSRTLRRRLKEEGVTFRELVGNVRRDLAKEFIRDESLTLMEITFLLGFADASSFSRAFRSWYGRSPSAVREEATANS